MLLGSQALTNDPYYNNVVLLLRGYDAASGQVFKDYSKYNRTITANGNVAHSTTQKKYGNSSIYFDGSGDYLSVANSSDLNLSSVNFTIEAWIYKTTTPSGDEQIIQKDGRREVSYIQYGMWVNASNKLCAFLGNGAGTSPTGTLYTGETTISLNAWHHVTIMKNGSQFYGFVDGNLQWNAFAAAMYDGGQNPLIGYQTGQPASQYFNGNIEELRITKGIARYTSNFTVPTQPFPVW